MTEVSGHPIVDVLDYKFHTYDPRLILKLKEENGRERTVRVRKAEGEDLGLDFETYLMDRARSCANRCIFCFVDQMPPGMRETLYFKDDDARLSFLMGNYITLTNLSQTGAPADHGPAHQPRQHLRPRHGPGAAGQSAEKPSGGGVSGHHGAALPRRGSR